MRTSRNVWLQEKNTWCYGFVHDFSKHSRVHKISKSVKPAHAAYAEPLSCALHAVERANIKNTDVVVVAGCGPIGLGMIAGAAVKKPAILIALDLDDRKLAVAKECGATLTINIGRENAVEIVKGLTEGYGADIYLEGTGHPSAVAQGLQILRKLGTFVLYSVFKEDVTVDWSIISDDKELDLLGAHLGPHCWPAAIAMIESGNYRWIKSVPTNFHWLISKKVLIWFLQEINQLRFRSYRNLFMDFEKRYLV